MSTTYVLMLYKKPFKITSLGQAFYAVAKVLYQLPYSPKI